MHHYAILIDGGFAKRKLGTGQQPAVAEDFSRLVSCIQQHERLKDLRLHRVYYYDAQPYSGTEQKPLGGEALEFGSQPMVARAKQLFEQLARQPYMALRFGELTFNGWGLKPKLLNKKDCTELRVKCEDLQPIIQQKGVDMRIGMDIAALTLKKQVQVIVLVTGDSDFVPAMKFARREGAQLFLVTLGQNVYPSMREHSDLVLDLDCLANF